MKTTPAATTKKAENTKALRSAHRSGAERQASVDGQADAIAAVQSLVADELDSWSHGEVAQNDDSTARLTGTIEDSDELLLLRYSETGERVLFETLMHRYEREIYSYLRRYIGNAEMAEDAFQGTFVQVHLKCDQFDSSRRFRPWLYAIATNQAIDVQRRNKRHRMVSLDAPTGADAAGRPATWGDKLVGGQIDPLKAASDQENGRWVNEAVHSLGDSLERVVQLVYYQGMKYREAADVLGIPVGTVKSRLHAAVQRLTTMWNDRRE